MLHLEPTQDSVDRMRVISAFININVTLAQYKDRYMNSNTASPTSVQMVDI